MKKNMLSILILALLIVNIVLTAVMMFSVTGTAKKTSALIDDISAAISLDLRNQTSDTEIAAVDVPIENIEVFSVGEELTIHLTKGADGKDHYYLVAVSLSMNTQHEDYKKLSANVESQVDLIKGEIISVISSHTMEEMQEDVDSVRMEILQRIQTMFNSKFITNVTFTKGIAQ